MKPHSRFGVFLRRNGNHILIGGATAYDEDEVSLVAILSEWTAGNNDAT